VVALAQTTAAPIVEFAWLIPAFPLLGFVMITFFGKRMGRASGPVATTMMIGAFVVSAIAFFQMIDLPADERSFTETLYSWIAAGSLEVSVSYLIDQLTVVMLLIVTGVGAAIHLYSVGYMRGDIREPRYFSYLNLFAFSMLVLVMADNFLVLFVGWELVGLCSYLLIGHWFEQRENATAAKKAFVVNRVGDLSFLIGIFLIVATVGSLDYAAVFGGAGGAIGTATATAIALLLFGGAVGKSAQIPLYVWLPDAMAGPTPVSALIHAATMVTAGVYMVARSAALFDIAPAAGDVVAWIGVATALLAGLIAVAQDDIKKVLAYSTVSQLGFMFVAVGVGAYATGVFHLTTHAFFKALLFLGAGSVMHALGNRTDITQMGGLWRKIPWTMVTFVAGWLAIIGFPFTSGFFSKDHILEAAYGAGENAIWILALVATVLTGFYMTRLVYLTFFGPSRVSEGIHPHESPPSMVFPLVLLAVGSLGMGFLGASPEAGRFQTFIAPATSSEIWHVEVGSSVGGTEGAEQHDILTGFPHREGGLSAGALSTMATVAGLGGALLALFMYGGRRFDWQARRERPSMVWQTVRNKLYVDDVYQFVFTGLGKVGATTLAYVVDLKIIDGAVNNIGVLTARLAGIGRKVQTGFVRSYALAIVGGTVILIGLLLGRTYA